MVSNTTEYNKIYNEKHKQEKKEYMYIYNRNHHYQQNEWRKNHKEQMEKYQKEYNRKWKSLNKERQIMHKHKWIKTQKGKEYQSQANSIYLRNKKWILILPNIFPENIPIDYHHIDGKLFVVPIPRKLHFKGRYTTEEHLKKTNEWIEFYYNLNPISIIMEK